MESEPTEAGLHPRHDTSYRFLLSSKKLFVELLRSFVKRGWTEDIAEENVEEIPHTFVLQDFKRQEADLVYRVKLHGQEVIFYLLLELQSTVDYRMPYRLLLYQVEIWRYLLQNDASLLHNKKSFHLPPIVPIVLYNGEKEWQAKRQFRELLAGEKMFESELLNFEYLFIDVVRYTEEELLQLSNTIGAFFLLDQTEEVPQLLVRLRKLGQIIKQLPPENQEKLMTWMDNILRNKLPKQEVNLHTIMKTAKEEEEMLRFEKALDNLERQGIEKGMQEGLLKGKYEGVQEGMLKGKLEGQRAEREEIAKRMLALGMEIDVIVATTGFSITEMKHLQK
ncbi:Rpn family recombination-promoting nuclease/putative transposase [Paenibacillus yanchengensis]|uniref:Rpn family recombination-promoting nuclease/putative transposase n=1 Tax=Paenibacillus yanchengensis TaxID=2035833 RepID=A0ABW4YF92_9BACL